MTSSDETCDLDQVPNRPKILNEIETLRPIFMEGYRRSRGLELFPNAWTLSMAPIKSPQKKRTTT